MYLLALDVPECQINPWFSNVWLFGDFVLKVYLGFSHHDQQTPVGQRFREGNSPISICDGNPRVDPALVHLDCVGDASAG